MVAIIKKWGNSPALRIPGSLARDMCLFHGSIVEMTIVDGKMITKSEGHRKISLSKMLKGITKNNRHSEENCCGVAGREIF
ncbi:MAG: AbrB/MazE/SpoVT family DNA-binding domain-containing protein [Elusimicrobia bacterium]|nr:AbrB/MazE/SpoVT family DNA-binding domain-containing protein [Elusimicrobiota bacterium]